MILMLDTSTPICKMTLVHNKESHEYSWEAGRKLSLGLLSFIQRALKEQGCDWSTISGIVLFKGPGSFTGLRIGASVVNALAYSREIPIVGSAGEHWQQEGADRLAAGESDQMVVPDYGSDANITTPRK